MIGEWNWLRTVLQRWALRLVVLNHWICYQKASYLVRGFQFGCENGKRMKMAHVRVR